MFDGFRGFLFFRIPRQLLFVRFNVKLLFLYVPFCVSLVLYAVDNNLCSFLFILSYLFVNDLNFFYAFKSNFLMAPASVGVDDGALRE